MYLDILVLFVAQEKGVSGIDNIVFDHESRLIPGIRCQYHYQCRTVGGGEGLRCITLF